VSSSSTPHLPRRSPGGGGYRVWPLTHLPISDADQLLLDKARRGLDRAKSARDGTERRNDEHPLSENEARVFSESLTTYVKAIIAYDEAYYRSQVDWDLASVQVSSLDEAIDVVNEFLAMTAHASAEYCWQLNEPPEHSWELHSWKHISYGDIIDLSKEAKWSDVPAIRMDAFVGSENVEPLLKRAIGREIEAVAAVNFLLPTMQDRIEAFKMFCSSDVLESSIREIPSSIELGMNYLRTIPGDPTSQNAEDARENLRRLTSRKSLTLGLRKQGRPRDTQHPESVRRLYIMGNALLRQGKRGQTGRFPNSPCIGSFVPKLRNGMAPTSPSPLFPYP
jgi:hypothetical protein